MAQLHRFARDIDRRIEARLAELGDLLARAEEASARLRAATADADQERPPAPEPAPERGEEPPAGQALSQESPPAAPGAVGHREIRDLADQGLSSVEIARRVGRPVGEVELVLSIRRAGTAQP